MAERRTVRDRRLSASWANNPGRKERGKRNRAVTADSIVNCPMPLWPSRLIRPVERMYVSCKSARARGHRSWLTV
jgi:hypothetical protein